MAGDPLHTRLCDILGIEFPIMAFSHCKDVVAAVCNAGGIGVLGETDKLPEEIAADIKWLRERIGSRPFGVDLLFPSSMPDSGNREDFEALIPDEHRRFVQRIKDEHHIPDPRPYTPEELRRHQPMLTRELARRQLDVLLDERVPLFAGGLGNPAFVLEAAHARGIKVFGLVGKVRQARREIEAGLDGIIAQGTDSAGHTGEIGTFSLVPQVRAIAGETPVIAAGGVGSGRHLVAALALGAVGVWTGTIWLACRESDTDMLLKEKILRATESDTTRSRIFSGKPIRMLKDMYTELWEKPDAPEPLDGPMQGLLMAPMFKAALDHKIEPFMHQAAGQVVGLINEMKPARQIVLDIVAEAQDVLESLMPDPTLAAP